MFGELDLIIAKSVGYCFCANRHPLAVNSADAQQYHSDIKYSLTLSSRHGFSWDIFLREVGLARKQVCGE